ncbi:MAG: DUF445 family protein, partial [Deferribacteraceae bacterium]|nr:DUF445 family protein [Deferribacteraceae bacterium]
MNSYIELLSIPISAGVVGYATNALAIRMLFRPFKPHWYTLGWQGIIPRTREILAANVGRTVGEKLVTAEEIDRTLSDPQISEKVRLAIYNTLRGELGESKLTGKLQLILESFVAPSVHTALSDPQLAHTIDTTAANIAKSAIHTILNVKRYKVAEYLRPLEGIDERSSVRDTLCFNVERAIRENINTVVNSGKSISELLPGVFDVDSIARQLSMQVIPIVGKLFRNREIADTLSQIFINYKAEQFGDSLGDRMKLAAVNVFLFDDRIVELTREKLPEVGFKIENDQKVRDIILKAISDKLKEFLSTPIGLLLDSIGKDKYYLLLHNLPQEIVRKAVPERLVHYLLEILKGDDSDMTVLELLEAAGVSTD